MVLKVITRQLTLSNTLITQKFEKFMEKLINLFKKSSSMSTKLVEIKAINKQLMSFLDALRNLKT